MGQFSRKTDKQCAQEAVAAVIVTGGDPELSGALIARMTTDELLRGRAYLASGKKITGR